MTEFTMQNNPQEISEEVIKRIQRFVVDLLEKVYATMDTESQFRMGMAACTAVRKVAEANPDYSWQTIAQDAFQEVVNKFQFNHKHLV